MTTILVKKFEAQKKKLLVEEFKQTAKEVSRGRVQPKRKPGTATAQKLTDAFEALKVLIALNKGNTIIKKEFFFIDPRKTKTIAFDNWYLSYAGSIVNKNPEKRVRLAGTDLMLSSRSVRRRMNFDGFELDITRRVLFDPVTAPTLTPGETILRTRALQRRQRQQQAPGRCFSDSPTTSQNPIKTYSTTRPPQLRRKSDVGTPQRPRRDL